MGREEEPLEFLDGASVLEEQMITLQYPLS